MCGGHRLPGPEPAPKAVTEPLGSGCRSGACHELCPEVAPSVILEHKVK